jgi:hypothetical protein
VSVPIRLSLPADPGRLGVVRDVVGTAFAGDGRESEAWDDVAIAIDEVVLELCSGAGVERLSLVIGDTSVDVEGTGDAPAWEPSPVVDRLITRLAAVTVVAGDGVVRLRLAPMARS